MIIKPSYQSNLIKELWNGSNTIPVKFVTEDDKVYEGELRQKDSKKIFSYKKKRKESSITEENIDKYIEKFLKAHPEILDKYIERYIEQNLRIDRHIFKSGEYKFKALALFIKGKSNNPITYCDTEIIY